MLNTPKLGQCEECHRIIIADELDLYDGLCEECFNNTPYLSIFEDDFIESETNQKTLESPPTT